MLPRTRYHNYAIISREHPLVPLVEEFSELHISYRGHRLSSGVVDATIDVFNTITRELLPTPQKSHYTFNLRDMAKVFQGESRGSYHTY